MGHSKGAYSTFNRWRQVLAVAMGGSFHNHSPEFIKAFCDEKGEPPHPGMWYVDDAFSRKDYPGLWELLSHADNEGEISLPFCILLAAELEELLPVIKGLDESKHPAMAKDDACRRTEDFIEGCRKAVADNASLEFR